MALGLCKMWAGNALRIQAGPFQRKGPRKLVCHFHFHRLSPLMVADTHRLCLSVGLGTTNAANENVQALKKQEKIQH